VGQLEQQHPNQDSLRDFPVDILEAKEKQKEKRTANTKGEPTLLP
jgi:hypothetical protein